MCHAYENNGQLLALALRPGHRTDGSGLYLSRTLGPGCIAGRPPYHRIVLCRLADPVLHYADRRSVEPAWTLTRALCVRGLCAVRHTSVRWARCRNTGG